MTKSVTTETTTELKTLLIQQISQINDVSFLKALKTFVESETGPDIILLTPGQEEDIRASRKDIEKGSFIENKLLDKEISQWLRAR